MEIKELLKQKNIKVTKGRVLIYELLLHSNKNLTADDIYKECIKDENINLSTIYRTLELFEKKEIIEKVFAKDGTSAYTVSKNKHKHIVECDVCHEEIEVACPIKQIEEILKNETGFKVTEHTIQLKGVCEKCTK
ncbi:MAG: Fur family transcriptional regulator [Sarcina sp.]